MSLHDRNYAIQAFEQEAQEYETLTKAGLDWNGDELATGDLVFIADDDPEEMWGLGEEAYVIGFYHAKDSIFGGGGLRAVLKFEGCDPVSVLAGIIEKAADQG